MKPLVDFWLIPLVTIFFIVDPLAAVPAFLTMASGDSPEKRRTMAFKAAIAATIIRVVFAAGGGLILSIHLQRVLGKTGIHVMSRVMGLVLAPFAVQFILDGNRARAIPAA